MKTPLVTAIACIFSFSNLCQPALADGVDVILGELDRTIAYPEGDTVYVAAGTVSCNAGTVALDWYRLPDSRHPVIGLNMYRLLNGRMEQIGQSWLKHGFTALEHNICGFGCQPKHAGSQLGPGCSDPYGAGMNRGPNLGSRREMNPVTGVFDGATANDHSGHTHSTDLAHSLQVARSDLLAPGARLFIEGHYVAADDARAGNAFNNVAYRELSVEDGGGNIALLNTDLTQKYSPAILAWQGASFQSIYSPEAAIDNRDLHSRIIVGAKVEQVGGRRHRYEYAVYNMNSDRGVMQFGVPVGTLNVTNIGFSAVKSNDDGLSNEPWINSILDGRLVWTTKGHAEDRHANAIRWGTAYNFWFEADSPPTVGAVTLRKFKPGEGPDEVSAMIHAPTSK